MLLSFPLHDMKYLPRKLGNNYTQEQRVFLESVTVFIFWYIIQHYPVNVPKKKRQKKATKDKKGQRKKRSYTYMYTQADRT